MRVFRIEKELPWFLVWDLVWWTVVDWVLVWTNNPWGEFECKYHERQQQMLWQWLSYDFLKPVNEEEFPIDLLHCDWNAWTVKSYIDIEEYNSLLELLASRAKLEWLWHSQKLIISLYSWCNKVNQDVWALCLEIKKRMKKEWVLIQPKTDSARNKFEDMVWCGRDCKKDWCVHIEPKKTCFNCWK